MEYTEFDKEKYLRDALMLAEMKHYASQLGQLSLEGLRQELAKVQGESIQNAAQLGWLAKPFKEGKTTQVTLEQFIELHDRFGDHLSKCQSDQPDQAVAGFTGSAREAFAWLTDVEREHGNVRLEAYRETDETS